MKTIIVHKAAPTTEEDIENLQIIAEQSVSAGHNDDLFDLEAKDVVEAMIHCLPGGLVDQITCKLLQHSTSLLVISHDEVKRRSG